METRADGGFGSLLVVHSSNEMYGADRMLLRVIDSLPDSVDVVVLLPDDVEPGVDSVERALELRGVRTIVTDVPVLRRAYLRLSRLPELLRRARHFAALLRAEDPDVLWCATSATLLCAPLAALKGVRVRLLHNQEIWSGAERIVLSILAGFCSSVVSISQRSDRSVISPRHRKRIIANATDDPGEPAPMPAGPDVRFLVASRWNEWKGHGTLLHAWREAGEPGRLMIAGGPPKIGLGVDVHALVDELHLGESTEILGEVSDLGPLYDTAHYVLVPSDSPEPFGLVAIEAMSRGRAVIGSAGGGLGGVIADGYSGSLFSNGSVKELAVLLRAASLQDAERMGRNARTRFEEFYSLPAFSASIAVLWSELSRRVPRKHRWRPVP